MIHRRYVDAPHGQLHIAMAGQGPPVLLLHQTPRSWDEYRDVLPLLAPHHQAIAMDTPGFGASTPLATPSIEAWAATALHLLDALALPGAAVVGHHTGGAIALELAAAAPTRVRALVLSSCPYVDAPRRAAHAHARVIDQVDHRPDGTHLTELWSRRHPFYPADATDLLDRLTADALRAGPLAAEGHRVVNRYHMETRLSRITCPILLIDAPLDPHAHPNIPRLAAALPHATVATIPGGTVPLPDGHPEAFAAAVLRFLEPQRAQL